MLLVGSRALAHHISLDREAKDWDLYCLTEEWENIKSIYSLTANDKNLYTLNGEKLDISIVSEGSSLKIIELNKNSPKIKTPLGEAHIADLKTSYILKQASLFLSSSDKVLKHQKDLAKIGSLELDNEESQLLSLRIEEVKLHQEKLAFFNRYKIDRSIDHDSLHIWVAEALGSKAPLYPKYLKKDSAVIIDKEAFNKAPLKDKARLILEEAIVLTLERRVFPGIIRHPRRNIFTWLESNWDLANEQGIYFWIERLSTPGRLKDHPDFIALWAQENLNKILDEARSMPRLKFNEEFINFARRLRK